MIILIFISSSPFPPFAMSSISRIIMIYKSNPLPFPFFISFFTRQQRLSLSPFLFFLPPVPAPFPPLLSWRKMSGSSPTLTVPSHKTIDLEKAEAYSREEIINVHYTDDDEATVTASTKSSIGWYAHAFDGIWQFRHRVSSTGRGKETRCGYSLLSSIEISWLNFWALRSLSCSWTVYQPNRY